MSSPRTRGLAGWVAGSLAGAARRGLSLRSRQQLVLWVSRQVWLPRRSWWSLELLREWLDRDPAAYHRWVWRHHAAFPEIYSRLRFATGALDRARIELFADLVSTLRSRGAEPAAIGSVLEVGCSLGYLLRLVELDVFPGASVLDGVDIDRQAVDEGNAALREMRSRVRLHHLDAANLDDFLAGRRYDVIFSAGMLMYLDQAEASAMVRSMLRAADSALAITGVANPLHDNAEMAASEVREWDGAFVHNLDAMVRDAGGSILFRRWDGPREVEGISIYHLVAVDEQRP